MGPSALCENETLSGIGVVDVQKQNFLQFLLRARATLCGDRRGRCAKTKGAFFAILAARARPSAGIATWSRCKNSFFFFFFFFFAFSALRTQPSAWIVRVGLLLPWSCESSRFARDPLRGLCVSVVLCESLRSVRDCRQGPASGCKVATCKYKSGMQSNSPQLRLQSWKVDSGKVVACCTAQLHRESRQ